MTIRYIDDALELWGDVWKMRNAVGDRTYLPTFEELERDNPKNRKRGKGFDTQLRLLIVDIDKAVDEFGPDGWFIMLQQWAGNGGLRRYEWGQHQRIRDAVRARLNLKLKDRGIIKGKEVK